MFRLLFVLFYISFIQLDLILVLSIYYLDLTCLAQTVNIQSIVVDNNCRTNQSPNRSSNLKPAANMLLTELLTDKRGPLAKIWMSAHQEKKLSKRDAMGIDIEESVGMSFILPHDNLLTG